MKPDTEVTCRHICGHQDTRGPRNDIQTSNYDESVTSWGSNMEEEDDGGSDHHDRPQVTTRLSLQAWLNVECDEIATATAAAVLAPGIAPILSPVLSLPYKGSRVMLCVWDI